MQFQTPVFVATTGRWGLYYSVDRPVPYPEKAALNAAKRAPPMTWVRGFAAPRTRA